MQLGSMQVLDTQTLSPGKRVSTGDLKVDPSNVSVIGDMMLLGFTVP